jgi:ABC transporter DrrB family efflux protein
MRDHDRIDPCLSVERLGRGRKLRMSLRDVGGMTARNLRRTLRTPQLIVMTVAQPATILLLFRYILGGSIHVVGFDYVNYMVPGVLLEAVLLGGMTTALAIAQDFQTGIINRFKSLPMTRSAVLVGRTLADLCRSVLALVSTLGLAVIVGFSFHNRIGPCLLALVLLVGFGYAFTWVYVSIGLFVKDPQAAQMASILPFFLLLFVSSALVPVSTMPHWLQPFARHQPVSVVIDASRALLQHAAVGTLLWQAAAWTVAFFGTFFAAASLMYRRANL